MPIDQSPDANGITNLVLWQSYPAQAFTPVLEKWGLDYCSGYTYTLNYVSGTPQTANYGADLYTAFTFNTPSQNTIDVLLDDLSWVGSHDIEIQGCLGSTTGAFNFPTNCASTTWTLDVTNPCETTSFTTSYPGLSMTYNVADPVTGIQYEIPTDSASASYGNGFDKCGSRIHYLLSANGEQIYPRTVSSTSASFQGTSTYPFIEFLFYPDGDPTTQGTTPIYQINLLTDSENYYGLHQF